MPINPLPPLAIAGCERSKRCLLLWRAVGKGTGRGGGSRRERYSNSAKVWLALDDARNVDHFAGF